jgi:hypothetical protein
VLVVITTKLKKNTEGQENRRAKEETRREKDCLNRIPAEHSKRQGRTKNVPEGQLPIARRFSGRDSRAPL